MAGAQPKVRAMLEGLAVQAPALPVISNVTARPHGQPEEVRRLLAEQVISPVRWEDSIRYLLAQGFTRFVELGPGTALSGFVKRIDRTAVDAQRGRCSKPGGGGQGDSRDPLIFHNSTTYVTTSRSNCRHHRRGPGDWAGHRA